MGVHNELARAQYTYCLSLMVINKNYTISDKQMKSRSDYFDYHNTYLKNKFWQVCLK